MIHIANLFGRSPFAPLQKHMEKVTDCIREVVVLFLAMREKKWKRLEELAEKISTLEHAADLTKNDIKNNLPGSLFLSIKQSNFLEILELQDSLADIAEDIAVLVTLRKLEFYPEFEIHFFAFLEKNLDTFESSRKIILALNDLVETSFGGQEAQDVKHMVEGVAFKEHEADVIQRTLLKSFYQCENNMSFGEYLQWERVFATVGAIANCSEKLANSVRMSLDLK